MKERMRTFVDTTIVGVAWGLRSWMRTGTQFVIHKGVGGPEWEKHVLQVCGAAQGGQP